jgi:hypothetical protein
MPDSQGDLVLPLLLDSAHRHDLRVAPHIEPYRDRNPINLSEHLRYIIGRYGAHPALYRMQRRGQSLPVFYVYDSYLTPAGAWKELLSAKGNLSVRGTQFDGIFLGLLVDMQHRYDIRKSHFDGECMVIYKLYEYRINGVHLFIDSFIHMFIHFYHLCYLSCTYLYYKYLF